MSFHQMESTTGTAGTASITIQNTAPTLSGLSITPTGTTYNDSLTCSATVTDPDETPLPSYEWSIDGNVVGSSATLDLLSAGAMPDDVVVCTVSVTDSDNATATKFFPEPLRIVCLWSIQ